MLFHTPQFVLLFLLVLPLALYAGSRTRRAALLAASYAFYMWFSIPLAGLLVFSTALDFGVGRAIHASADARRRRAWLCVSLVGNLGVLAFFKYGNWFLDSLNGIAQLATGEAPFRHYDVILPLGISFYTFQSMSYAIDVYRRRLTPTSSWLSFALYVAFFPQLVAGPIVRATCLLPQLERGPRFVPGQAREALGWVGYGLFKKLVIADHLALIVDCVYAAPEQFGAWDVTLATYAFAFQIYCDFSGYTDMARGIAGLLGYRLERNFDFPYFACGVRDFWRRWHISLSTWLRDYLYISLGGNRCAAWRRDLNVLLTMFLGGLWHGANWTFAVWGLLHGVWIVWEQHRRRSAAPAASPLGKLALALATFHGVCLTWVFFRADSLAHAGALLARLTELEAAPRQLEVFAYVLPVLALDAAVWRGVHLPWTTRPLWFWTAATAGLACVLLLGNFRGAEFVYFQF